MAPARAGGAIVPDSTPSPAARVARQEPGACCAIQRRMSSARQTVTRGDNLTGCGNVFASMRRHSVDFEIGTNCSTCVCRKKPVSGRQSLGDGIRGAALCTVAVGGKDGVGDERMIWPVAASAA